MTQGYVILAQNNHTTDYVQCARVLAKSLKSVGDTRSITLLTDSLKYDNLDTFDQVILLDQTVGNHAWKLNDDWQVYDLSPYDETFKIESDVIVTRSIDHWWDICRDREIVVATGTRNFRQHVSTVRSYRRMLDENLLPDVYNGITYFKKTQLAKDFFNLVKTFFNNWTEFNDILKYDHVQEFGDTDTIYAMICKILGVEKTTLPTNIIQWVHMKSMINGTMNPWTKECIWELISSDFRINTISQMYPVHYHDKELAKYLEPIYDKQLNTN